MSPSRSSVRRPILAFQAHLEAVRTETEERLAAVWAEAIEALRPHGGDVVRMASAARDLTMRGGKRFRAAMLVAAFSGAAPRADAEPALAAGVAVELLQTYLLIQDDWMDHDPVRRGGPSVHAALADAFGDAHLGAASALLASDLTWGLSVRTLTSARVKAPRKLRALELFCAMHQDVVAGQQLDVLGRAEDVEKMHALKTGSYTVRGPLLLGAALAGAPKRLVQALAAYAAPLGVAFQLRDDLLGTFAKQEETGKREGTDLREGKRTALIAEADARLDAGGKGALARAFGREDASDDDVRAATQALSQCGARAAVEDRLRSLCAEAADLATKLPVSEHTRHIFAGAAAALLPA
jgi:geranylgeranyl diphosphate synthase type I